MNRRWRLAWGLMAAALFGGMVMLPRPEMARAVVAPAPVPIAWELTLKSYAPERMYFTPAGKTEQQTLWYFRYTVTNNTGKDLLYTPEIQLLTDTGQILSSGKGVPDGVFERIKALYNNPLMISPIQVLGKLLQGEDNAKDSCAIFSDVDADARVFRIQIAGLSGETAEVTNPLTQAKVILHKTLVLEYVMPGEAIGIPPQPKLKSKTWVMK